MPGLGFIVKLAFGGLGWVKKVIATAVDFAKTNPWQAAVVLLLLLCGWLWHGWSKADKATAVQHTGWVNETRGRMADRAAYAQAQKDAVAKQLATDQATLAGQQDHIYQLEKTNARLDAAHDSDMQRFAAGHRMPGIPAATGGAPGGSGATCVYPGPGAPGDGSTPGDTFAFSAAEAEATRKVEVQNTERGELLRGLIEQGLAITVP